MKKNDLNFELQSRVRRYLEFISKNESDAAEKQTILNKLTKSLKREVLLEANGKLIKDNFFFKNFTKEFQEEVTLCLKELRLSPEEYVFKVSFSIY